jgi:Cft2 family RNA processing exonuclease
MSWEVQQLRNSLFLPQLDLWLDAHFRTPCAFVSHAHFDHLAAHQKIICSHGTARLASERMKISAEFDIFPFSTPHPFRDATFCLYPAGHIFGSSQIWIEHKGESLLYTGDFKLRESRSAEKCATPCADVLVMETTFGLPRYQFPPEEKILADIVHFCRQTLEDNEVPVLFAYSLGKSQELLRGLAGAALPVMLHPKTFKLTRAYEALGMSFPSYAEFSGPESSGHVVICPPQSNGTSWLRKIKRRRTAAVTGWAMDAGAVYRYQCDAVFPLSDHADYPDLLRFVEAVKPKKILTTHGFAREFARDLRSRGHEAWAIGLDNQLEMPLPC